MKLIRVGVDLAKNVFQMPEVDRLGRFLSYTGPQHPARCRHSDELILKTKKNESDKL